jgi:lipid-A-disaccharide synthase
MKPEIIAKVPEKYADKFTVVGDLMADVSQEGKEDSYTASFLLSPELIGLLPGSKAAKLAQGVPCV